MKLNANESLKSNWQKRERQSAEMLAEALERLIGGKLPDSEDKRGHDQSVRFNVTPAFMRAVSAIYESAPKGLYKNRSEFFRAIFSMALYLASEFFEDGTPAGQEIMREVRNILAKYDALVKASEIRSLDEEYNMMTQSFARSKMANRYNLMQEAEETRKAHVDIMQPNVDIHTPQDGEN